MRGRSEVGCWVTQARGGRGNAPAPEPANAEAERWEVGPPASKVALGPELQTARLQSLRPARARRGGGAPGGAEPRARWQLAPDRFSLSFPALDRLSIWRAVAARFLGRLGT